MLSLENLASDKQASSEAYKIRCIAGGQNCKIRAMSCSQTHWKKKLCSEWSAGKRNKAFEKHETSKLTSTRLKEAVQDWKIWTEVVHRIVKNWTV